MLVTNAKGLALKAFSMWCNYLGLFVLIAPEIRYWVWEIDTNPTLVWWLGIGLIVAGTIGRLVNQGIADD